MRFAASRKLTSGPDDRRALMQARRISGRNVRAPCAVSSALNRAMREAASPTSRYRMAASSCASGGARCRAAAIVVARAAMPSEARFNISSPPPLMRQVPAAWNDGLGDQYQKGLPYLQGVGHAAQEQNTQAEGEGEAARRPRRDCRPEPRMGDALPDMRLRKRNLPKGILSTTSSQPAKSSGF